MLDYKDARDKFIDSEFKQIGFNLQVARNEAIIFSTKKAWADMYPINIENIKAITRDAKVYTEVMGGLHDLVDDLLKECNGKSAIEFDEIHRKFCDQFIGIMTEKLGYDFSGYFGKAQKFINMALKYLSCFECLDAGMFKFCHMPLDVYILHWIYQVTGVFINKWSKVGPDVYYQIQRDIRKAIPEDMTLLQYEFIIWEKEKQAMVDCDKLTIDKYNELKRI